MKSKNTISIKEASLLIGAFLMIGYAFTQSNTVKDQNESLVQKDKKTVSVISKSNEDRMKVSKDSPTSPKRFLAQASQNDEESSLKKSSFSGLNQIWEAERCISEKDCDYPNNDPRAYSLTAYKKLSEAIDANRKTLLKNWNSKIAKKVSEYFTFSDGYLKESLLNLVQDLPKEQAAAYTDEVIEEVLHYHDAELIPDTLTFLKGQLSTNNQKHIYSEIGKALSHGSPQVSEALAQNIDSFLNDQSISEFKNVAQNLPQHSPEKTYLDASIKEYEMRQSGG